MPVQEKELYDTMQNNATSSSNANQTSDEDLSPQQRTFLNMVRSMNISSSSVNAMRTVPSPKKICGNVPIQTIEENACQVLDEDWMEDSKNKYMSVLQKSGLLTHPRVPRNNTPTKTLYNSVYSIRNPNYGSVYVGWWNRNLDGFLKDLEKNNAKIGKSNEC